MPPHSPQSSGSTPSSGDNDDDDDDNDNGGGDGGDSRRQAMTGETGTYRYMAPEVFLQQPYNEKADVYSYAIIMWYVHAGQPPFVLDDPKSIAARAAHAGERLRPDPGVFRRCRTALRIIPPMWSHDPDDRPPFEAVLADLELAQTATGRRRSSSSSSNSNNNNLRRLSSSSSRRGGGGGGGGGGDGTNNYASSQWSSSLECLGENKATTTAGGGSGGGKKKGCLIS